MPKHQESITLRDTGDYENGWEGNLSVYEITGIAMGRETGELVYDIRGPSVPTNVNRALAEGFGKAIAEVRRARSGPTILYIIDMIGEKVTDDVVEELRDRDVHVIFEPRAGIRRPWSPLDVCD